MAVEPPNRSAIRGAQLARLRDLLRALVPGNGFYRRKLSATRGERAELSSIEEFTETVPFTTKAELAEDQLADPPYGTNLTFPLDHYVRCHATSGTTGHPLRWLDTPESWDEMVRSWMEVFAAAGAVRADRAFFAFSFGPFIGFWLAFEAAARLGMLCLPGGGLSSAARLRLILDNQVTVLCCTPTYAIRLAEVAVAEGVELSRSQVRRIIVAGEPGGSIPAVRDRIEHLWKGARVFDHHGMTEIGPVTYECPKRPGILHVLERAYIAEVIHPATGLAVPAGCEGELVLTSLGRIGSPILRYRTGDLVKPSFSEYCVCGRSELALEGGILGRTDDMVTIRGINVYPSAIEGIVRRYVDVAEYQVEISESNALVELALRVEPEPACSNPEALAAALEKTFQTMLHLRIPVVLVPPGSLPRFELKAQRWIRPRTGPLGSRGERGR